VLIPKGCHVLNDKHRDPFDSTFPRDPDTLQITSSPEAPLPKIVIFGTDGREASTVRIGDRLSFRIEIPEQTPYGIFARSCVAMAKDARSTFEIVDEHGYAVDPYQRCPVSNITRVYV
jgi:hypothetical protein